MRRDRMTLKMGAVVLAVFAMAVFMPGQGMAGDLNPPADAVDGSGNPVPTTPELPSWSKRLAASERFEEIWPGEAVLDRESGLVWRKTPVNGTWNWYFANLNCYGGSHGARYGWRLPTAPELRHLFGTYGPPTSIFPNYPRGGYWTSTEVEMMPGKSWKVYFWEGGNQYTMTNEDQATALYIWCVRGGNNHR